MAMFDDLIPARTYNANTSGAGSGALQYNPQTGFTTLAPGVSGPEIMAATHDGTYAALAASLGGGASTQGDVSKRIGPHPDLNTYGTNFSKALYVWLHGGNPATLAHPSSQLSYAQAHPHPTPGTGTPGTGTGTPGAPGAPGTTPGTGTGAGGGSSSALGAWDAFRNSTNYQFRLAEGDKAINQDYAAHGVLQSGAAQKALIDYNQNFAANELGNYQDRLAQQQGVGMSAGSALAGVGQNMVGQITANNTSAAQTAADAALIHGQAGANMYGSIGSALGTAAGALGSSFSHPATSMPTPYYGNAPLSSGLTNSQPLPW